MTHRPDPIALSRRAAAPMLAALAALVLAPAERAAAQAFPSKPIIMVVPFAAGGPTDIVARVISERLSITLGQQVIVENVAGAAGTAGAARVARSTPDGYTLLMGPMSTMSFSPALYPNAPVNTRTDLEAVGLVASAPMLLTVANNVPATDLKGFMEHMKRDPSKINNGHAGVGSTSHLACLLMQNRIGAQPTMVPYRGTGPAIQDLVAGNVGYICDQVTSLVGQVQSNTIRPIAMLSPSRSPLLPNVPTAAEAGLPGVEMLVWNAVFAPKGTPDAIVNQINAAIGRALDETAVRDRFLQLGAETPAGAARSVQHMRAMHQADVDKWTAVIRAANITVQ